MRHQTRSTRTIYLIRHGQPIQSAPSRCGYAWDVPLDHVGLYQGKQLELWAKSKDLTAVFCSSAQRSVQTAQFLARGSLAPSIVEDLAEMDSGLWNGLTFEEIRAQFPAEYAARGQHLGTIPPPGGESFWDAGLRMSACINRLMEQTCGDIALVAHGGINRGWLCQLLEQDADSALSLRQPWGGISTIEANGPGLFHVSTHGIRPECCPGPPVLEQLFTTHQVPAHVQAHGEAVARCALSLAQQIDQPVDQELLWGACLLHDMVRGAPHHSHVCAKILDREGYPLLAEIIKGHHDLPKQTRTEADLLFLADKLIQGTQRVSLDQRFQGSREKCSTPEALAAWQSRYQRALQIQSHYQLSL